jgi:hypothetical protein
MLIIDHTKSQHTLYVYNHVTNINGATGQSE